MKEPSILYHYTTVDTLYSIINNIIGETPIGVPIYDLNFYKFNMWATHISYMNDPTDTLYYKECFDKAIDHYLDSDSCISRENVKSLHTMKMLMGLANILQGIPSLISFSENIDNLPM